MASVNKVILVGNLGKDPEVRTLTNGAQIARFPLATSESYTNKDGQKVDLTEWHNIVAWRGLASISERFLKKGNKVYVEGRLRTRQYEDKEGVKKYSTEIEAIEIVLIDKPQGLNSNYTQTPSSNNNTNTENINSSYSPEPASGEDDLPF